MAQEPEVPNELQQLRLRLEIASEERAYIQLLPQEIRISFKDMDVKSLPLERFEATGNSRPRLARVEALQPVFPVEGVVKVVSLPEGGTAAEEADLGDKTATVSSVDDIVSVGEMPGTYVIRLSDGSFIYVTSDRESGLLQAPRIVLFQLRLVYGYLWKRTRDASVRAIRIRMAGEDAQALYWMLKTDTGVIY